MPNTDLAERLSSAGIACLSDNCSEHGLPVAGGNFHSDLVSLARARPASEKILAEIFFNLALYLAKMSELCIAHCNMNMENILLDKNLNPVLSDFSSSTEPANWQHLAQDLQALGKIMYELIEPESSSWQKNITQSQKLMNLRSGLRSTALQLVQSRITSASQLLSSLIQIHPSLIQHKSIYPTPPAVTLDFSNSVSLA